MTPASPDAFGEDLYEDQYHPHAAVDIFGKYIINKGNMADMVNEEIREDFDEGDNDSSERGSDEN
jgi:hypothetical protein